MPLHHHINKDGFRLRGIELSRIDGFSDVVFGFALTLIVVSLEVPHTYNELHAVLLGFVPFAICFIFLILVWWDHYTFFRRFNLHDRTTIFLNCGLLFTVLFYVYPLKFLFNLIAAQATGQSRNVFTQVGQPRELMMVYGAGFAAIYFIYAAMYWNAWRQRKHAHLNPLETTLTLSYMWDHFGVGCVGLLCCLAARLLPPDQAGNAGWFFFIIGIWKTVHGTVSGKLTNAARARTAPEDLTAPPAHL